MDQETKGWQMRGQHIERRRRTMSSVGGQIHKFDGGGSDRTSAGWC